jgi:hypothetical protein
MKLFIRLFSLYFILAFFFTAPQQLQKRWTGGVVFILSINGIKVFFFFFFFFFFLQVSYIPKFLLTEYFNVYSPLSRNLLPRVGLYSSLEQRRQRST